MRPHQHASLLATRQRGIDASPGTAKVKAHGKGHKRFQTASVVSIKDGGRY
jgi:hypothetical protein